MPNSSIRWIKGAGSMRLIGIAVFAAWMMAVQTPAQQSAPQGSASAKTVIKHVPMKNTPVTSGQDMYAAYCASCHGATGRGDGAAASLLKQRPANLQALSAGNSGQFPSLRVMQVLLGNAEPPAGRASEMPNWCPAFQSLDRHNNLVTRLRVYNLSKHIETLQVPAS